jgi:NAD(P)-dependent dehydrogenase (short-subunit alcohol dehydrogenase family)
VEGLDSSDLDLAIDLNLRSQLATTEAAIAHIRARVAAGGSGALLYTASTAGLVGSGMSPVYSMVKSGVVGFVRSLSLRLAPENIRVNAICPGPIDTPMLRVFVKRPDEQAKAGMDAEQLVAARQDKVPMRRYGHPHEVAAAALFLISDEASYVTGAALPVDGGFTAA